MTILAALVLLTSWRPSAGASKLRVHTRASEWSLEELEERGEGLAPPEILLMSSPMERKVSYVELIDHKAHGSVRPLIDTGLGEPKGLAYDPSQRALYIADTGQRKIFRYYLAVRAAADPEFEYEVVVHDVQTTVLEDVNSQWLAVDGNGNLFFSDQDRRAISMLKLRVIERIAAGKVDITNIPHATLQEAAAAAASGTSSTQSSVISLYKANPAVAGLRVGDQYHTAVTEASFGVKSYVAAPAGVAVDGPYIVWANAEGGQEDGAVVSGPITPPSTPDAIGAGAAESHPLTRSLDSALGVVAVDSMLIMSGETTVVYGLCRGGSGVQTLADTFASPRGLAWDGESTAYVADAGASAVFSLPTGRCHAGLPTRPVVSFHDVFGLALLKGKALEEVHTRYQDGLGVLDYMQNFVRWVLR